MPLDHQAWQYKIAVVGVKTEEDNFPRCEFWARTRDYEAGPMRRPASEQPLIWAVEEPLICWKSNYQPKAPPPRPCLDVKQTAAAVLFVNFQRKKHFFCLRQMQANSAEKDQMGFM